MAESKNTDFTLARNNYTSFDALTLKQLIKQRLNEEGVFTDQVFEGSNISAIIDIIAYSYHTLLFYTLTSCLCCGVLSISKFI